MIGKAFPPAKLASVLSLALLFASIAVFNVRVHGQVILGSIVGTIVDTSGGSIAGAKVTVTNTGTGERRAGASRVGGEYEFLNLVPGIYRVEVEPAAGQIDFRICGAARRGHCRWGAIGGARAASVGMGKRTCSIGNSLR